jgi:four helix bundle protein
MAKVDRFEELVCWKSARKLVIMVYKMTSSQKMQYDWDLIRQLRRAAVSVMNNIAEGFSRYHRNDFKHFLDISQSSAAEIKSMLYIVEDLNYIDKNELNIVHDQTDKTRNQILGLIKYLDRKNNQNT